MDNGATPQAKKIERFVRFHFRNERKGEQCSHLILRHVTPKAQGSGAELATIERPGKTVDDIIIEMAQELEAAAENDASGLGGGQSYVIQAYYGEDKRPHGRCTFRAEGLNDIDTDEYSSEPPSLAGVTTQMMRHTEALTRALVMSQHQITHIQRQMIEGLHSRNENMEKVHSDLIMERERLLDQRLERDLAVREASDSAENRKALLNTVKTYIPIALNKLNGRKALPAADPTRLMVEQLYESFDPSQFKTLQKMLRPEQMALLAELAPGQPGSDDDEGSSPQTQ